MWDASKCDLCGDCLTKCLYISYDRDKAVSDIRALMEGKEADIVNKCITCCACREYCPTGADPLSLIIGAIEKAGIFPVSEEDLVARSHDVPTDIIRGDPDKPALSICTMGQYIPEGALDGQLFQGMTLVMGGDYYCFIGWEHFGKESPIEKYARRFIDNLASLNKDIVFLDEILELIGVERPPRKYERETALCCTAPVIGTRLDMAVEFQEKNVRDAIECGTDALVTLCPVCDRVMRRPTGQLGLTKIYITDLCRVALGEIPWPTEAG